MMDHGRLTLASLLCVLVLIEVAGAQQLSNDAPLPGGSYRGRYIGFQPRFGQVPPPQPPHHVGGPTVDGVIADGVVGAPEYSVAVGEHPVVESGHYVDGHGGAFRPWFWGRAEAIAWWTKGMFVPVLATTSAVGVPQEEAGVLGLDSTSVLFGGDELNDKSRGGGRYTVGFWIDGCQTRGIELSYLNLDTEETGFRGSTDEFGIMARPFFNTLTGGEDSRLIAFPDLVEGQLDISVATRFQTGELQWRRSTGGGRCGGCVDYYFGYRYAELEDSVNIGESTLSLDGPIDGTSFLLSDRFETENQFHGAQFAGRLTSFSSPLWSMELLGKVALGNTRQRASNSGSTQITTPSGETSTQNVGLLVQDTNAGTFTNDEFSTVVELGATLRRHFGCDLALTFGYTFFLWTDVVRAGETIDTRVNVTQIPPGTLDGEPVPTFIPATTDFWAHGLRAGLEYAY